MDAFGSVAYGLWRLLDGSAAARLLMSKARLGPILHKGETVHKFKKVVKSKVAINISCSYTFMSKVRKTNVPTDPDNSFDQMMVRCGSLDKLLRITAYILRLGGKDKPATLEISAREREEAWFFLLSWEQKCRLD